MFESAELGHSIDKKTFKAEMEQLRQDLQQAQYELWQQARFPVLILVSGLDGAGKGETINTLYEWMDPRYLSTLSFDHLLAEQASHPFMWRFWQALPPKGRIGIFSGSWYSIPIQRLTNGEIDQAFFDQRLQQFSRFEAMLVSEGALVLKFWFHLSRKKQKHRLKKLESDPRSAWRVTPESWRQLKIYNRIRSIAAHLLRASNTPWAPWTVIEGTDDRYRSLTTGKVILEALKTRLAQTENWGYPVAPPIFPRTDKLDVLTSLNLKQRLEKEAYKDRLACAQGRLSELVRRLENSPHALVIAFEGTDAAGKGGSIRRIAAAMDARHYQIIPIAAPTEEERKQPYLWRFWRHIPRKGRVAIFDRTWYGRVLVERVEELCSEADWRRAYTEINDFEHELTSDGVILVKFWLQISKEEQLRRFKEREQVAFKRFKITTEDWRNREKWDQYHQAVCDMIERTSTETVPWTLVEANDKKFARVKILETLCDRLEAALKDAT